jgi:hypothetical protein
VFGHLFICLDSTCGFANPAIQTPSPQTLLAATVWSLLIQLQDVFNCGNNQCYCRFKILDGSCKYGLVRSCKLVVRRCAYCINRRHDSYGATRMPQLTATSVTTGTCNTSRAVVDLNGKDFYEFWSSHRSRDS